MLVFLRISDVCSSALYEEKRSHFTVVELTFDGRHEVIRLVSEIIFSNRSFSLYACFKEWLFRNSEACLQMLSVFFIITCIGLRSVNSLRIKSSILHCDRNAMSDLVQASLIHNIYIKPLSAIIDSHSIIHHSFADDFQLQMSAPPYRISEILHSMLSCISDVKAWATANMLKLNDSKTEFMLVTSKRSKHLHNLPTSITIGNAQIPFKQSMKNLDFTLDCHLTMNAHVSNIARTCYFELRRLASIRRFLTSTATATLVSAFVLSRNDYCSSLLFGSTNDVTSHLQRIQNYAARVIFRLPMSSSIAIHLKSLHWLPVKVRSTYKIACLCYHCHNSTAPSYVTDMLHKKP